MEKGLDAESNQWVPNKNCYISDIQTQEATSVRRTLSIISLVCEADRQKRARDSMMGVAGKPTTTVARPR